MSENKQAVQPMSDHDWLIEASDEIDAIERVGYESDVEATLYIMLSDKVARIMTWWMRRIAKSMEQRAGAVPPGAHWQRCLAAEHRANEERKGA